MKKKYEKLVRDNIPEIIQKEGKVCSTRTLDETEYLTALNTKLQEEVVEYLNSHDIIELADIEEVIYAILKTKKYSISKFQNIRKEKAHKNGVFNKKIFLEYVDDGNE